MKFAACTDVGRVRKGNEDAFLTAKNLFAVADGMGGHMAGEVASSLALEGLQKEVERGAKTDPEELLLRAAQLANQTVFKNSLGKSDLQGMGTTLTAALKVGRKLIFAHVGDSRAYLLRTGELVQLTQDHSVVAEMVRRGKLKPEEAESHPARSILTRALGTEPRVEIDLLSQDTQKGDRILLCTDGLTSMVSRDRVREIASRAHPLEEICEELVAQANANGGEDNITVVLVEF
jgi:protein phosphatase